MIQAINDLKILRLLALCAAVLALGVVMLGAYTRLTDAGLGCPDWPGCYGHAVLPSAPLVRQDAQRQYPDQPIESLKAWTEMAHRYAAGTLSCFIVLINVVVWRARRKGRALPWKTPLGLCVLLMGQAALGMWTVTLKLWPVVVMGHLLGGLLIFAGLVTLVCQRRVNRLFKPRCPAWSTMHVLVRVLMVLVFCQIALGGWVSSNYAGIACIGFPQCNGQWIPALHLNEAFRVFSPDGLNHQGGLLEPAVRATIQWVHRCGAYIVFLSVMCVALWIVRVSPVVRVRRWAWIVMALVLAQCLLGIFNVLYLLPLMIAVAHNGVAALLLGALVCLHGQISWASQGESECP